MTAPASAHFTEAKTSLALFNDVSCRDALVKWGLPPTPRASGWLVQHFTFSTADVAQPSTDAMALPLTSLRFFHHGLARPLLQAFFASPAVRAALRAAAPTPRRQAPGGEDVMVDGHDAPRACAVTATPLRRTWTSLDPLDRLADKGVVRRVPASTTPTAAPDSAYDEDIIFGGERMPIVKCMERSLPQEVLIADELRSLFLSAHSRSTYGGGAEDDEEDEDGMGYYGYGGGRGLSSKELRSIFSDAEREEVLYHILWRLIAGGGAMNQFEDDFCIYKDAARTWMKQLLTSITPTKLEEEDAELIPVIQSHVYQVHSVVDEATGRCVLFGDAAGDDMAPSNLNYCYVIVSPQQDQMVLWYHCS